MKYIHGSGKGSHAKFCDPSDEQQGISSPTAQGKW